MNKLNKSRARSARWRARISDAGFSTLEVVVSLVITSTVVLGSGAAMVTSARITVASQQEVRYWTAIEYQAETLVASETLAAASSSGSWGGTAKPSTTEGGTDCSGFEAANPELSILSMELTDVQMKECLNAVESGTLSQSQTLSGYGSDWQLTDAAAGRVMVIVDKARPKDGLTKDTVVVYLHDPSL